MYSKIFIISTISLFLLACEDQPEVKPEVNWTKEQSTNLGKELAIEEEIDIKAFLKSHPDWNMVKTGSGLRYYKYENGEGDTIIAGQIAEIEYVVGLLDGTECYRTEEDEYEEIVVDRSEIESGVQEAVKLMRVGDKAKLIIPSHLGHGLLGDRNKIPPLTPLLIDLRVTGVKENI